MRKILGIVIFLLTLLPLIGSGDAFTIKAQNFAFENGEYWLPDVDVTAEHKVVCECCNQSFRDNDAFDAHLRYDNVCADYYNPKSNNSDDDDDNIINGHCCFCGQPEDQCTCPGAGCNGSYGGGNSGFGGETIIIWNDSGYGNFGQDNDKLFDDVADTPEPPSDSGYTAEQCLEFAKQISKTIRKLIEKLEKEGRIKYSDKDINCHYNPKTGCIILPANSDFTEGAVVHELIHYIQDELGILNIDICGSDNEYQAYVVNYIFMTAMGYMSFNAPQGVSGNVWEDFKKAVDIYCKKNNEELVYNQTFIDILNGLNHVQLSEMFRDYWRSMDEILPTDHSIYYYAHDDNYNWSWELILKLLGFIKK